MSRGLRRLERSSLLCRNAGSAGRASPPLLFGLAPRGVCRAGDIAAAAVGCYPTFSPLPAREPCRHPGGFPLVCHRALLRRRYLFCGTFRESSQRPPRKAVVPTVPLALPGALPYFACAKWCPDFPPALPLSTLRQTQGKPAIVQLTRHFYYIVDLPESDRRFRFSFSSSTIGQNRYNAYAKTNQDA